MTDLGIEITSGVWCIVSMSYMSIVLYKLAQFSLKYVLKFSYHDYGHENLNWPTDLIRTSLNRMTNLTIINRDRELLRSARQFVRKIKLGLLNKRCFLEAGLWITH